MNKTLNIGLAGYSFIIDENAYQQLNQYIQALRNALSPEEVEEVMLDIEYRMVEIFRDNLKNREIISEEDVQKVIAQIGKPEIMEGQDSTGKTSSDSKLDFEKIRYSTRSLFRDTTNQKIAGVCSGLAHWTKMDSTLMRTLWAAVFFFGLFVIPPFFLIVSIAYITLWAILPKAITATDFLKMKGEPINFDSLKNESTKLSQNQESGEYTPGSKVAGIQRDNSLWRIIRYFLGGIFSIIAFSWLLSMFTSFFFPKSVSLFGIDFTVDEYFDYYFDIQYIKLLIIALYVLVFVCPILIFSMISIKFFSPKTKVRNMGYITLLLIVITIIMGIFVGVHIGKAKMIYNGVNNENQNIAINTQRDTLYIDLKQEVIPKNFVGFDNGKLFTDKKTVYEKNTPSVSVTRDDSVTTPYLIVKTKAEGYNFPINSVVNVEVKGNEILLPNYIHFPYSERFRDYNVRYELVVPSQKVVIDKNKAIKIKDDKNDEGDDDENQDVNPFTMNENSSNNASFRSVQRLNYNGKKMDIERNSAFGDSIKINGKLYDEDTAERMIERFQEENE